MNCDKIMPLLSRLLDNELTFDERESVDDHVHACETCFALFLKLKEDSARLDEAFACLKGAREDFTNRTAVLIAERERPHVSAPAASPEDRKGLLSRLVVPALVSATASAAAFLAMAAAIRDKSPRTDVQRAFALEPRTAPEPLGRVPAMGELEVLPDRSPADARHDESAEPAPVVLDEAPPPADPPAETEALVENPSAAASQRDVDGEIRGKIDRLINAVLSADPSVDDLRREILSLGTLSRKVVGALMSRFDSESDILVKETLLRVLASIHSRDEGLGEFLALRYHSETSVPIRRLIVEGLIGNSYPGAVELFETILLQENEDFRVKVLAVQALGGLGTDEALDVLKSIALRDASDRVRIETVRVLGRFSSPELVEQFLAIIRSQTESFDIQEEALEAVTSSAPDLAAARAALEAVILDTPRPEIKARAKALILKIMASGERSEAR